MVIVLLVLKKVTGDAMKPKPRVEELTVVRVLAPQPDRREVSGGQLPQPPLLLVAERDRVDILLLPDLYRHTVFILLRAPLDLFRGSNGKRERMPADWQRWLGADRRER